MPKVAAVKKSSSVTINFEFERETKNTYRFAEVADEPVVGTLYVKKSAFKSAPTGLTVTIEAE